MSDERSELEQKIAAYHAENTFLLNKCEELRAQLAEQEKRLAAAEHLFGSLYCNPVFSLVNVNIGQQEERKWFVRHFTKKGWEVVRGFDSPIDAYLAAVKNGWIPEPKKGA